MRRCVGGPGPVRSGDQRVKHRSRVILSVPRCHGFGSVAAGRGELIVFDQLLAGEESRDLYAVDPSGGEPTRVRPGEYPHWSPDGSQLSFLDCLNPPDCTTGVALMERSTGKVHGFPMPDPDLFTACAVWAPSGETLACDGESESDPSRNGVYTVRVSDGQGLTRVTSNPGGVDAPVTYLPDGRLLLFSRTPAGAGEGSAKTALFVTSARGGKATRITPLGYTDDAASLVPGRPQHRLRDLRLALPGAPRRHRDEEDRREDDRRDTAEAHVRRRLLARREQHRLLRRRREPGLYLARPDGSGAERLTTSRTEDHHANWVSAGAPDRRSSAGVASRPDMVCLAVAGLGRTDSSSPTPIT